MKTKLTMLLMLICLVTGALAQEAKKFKVKISTIENGRETNIDTTFGSRAEMEAFMNANGFKTELPELPALPELPELPPIPDLPELPNMEKIEIEIDDANLSDQEKAELKKEMENAHIEMEKANKEMKIHRKEMQKSVKEMEKNREDYDRAIEEMKEFNKNVKVVRIDVNKDGDAEEEFNFIMNNNEMVSGDDNYKFIMHNCDEGAMGYKYIIDEIDGVAGKKCIVAVYCDSSQAGEDKVKVIRKVKATSDPSEEMKPRSAASKPRSTTTPTEVVDVPSQAPKRTENPNMLAASDFKLYPNPTEGKLNVSFKLEEPGPVQVRLMDATGRILVQETVDVDGGYFSKEYTIENKSKGTYLLQLKQGDKWRHEKVVVK